MALKRSSTGNDMIPCPDESELNLSLSLSSGIRHSYDEFGWENWHASVEATWSTLDDSRRRAEVQTALASVTAGDQESDFRDPDQLELTIDACDFMKLNLDEPHPAFGETVLIRNSANDIFYAADALSQDLADLVAPLVDFDSRGFTDQVRHASDDGWYDHLLIVQSIGITKNFRRLGIGGWAIARAIAQLAPTPNTLIAMTAAPLNRSTFLIEMGGNPEALEMTAEQGRAWDAACDRIGANWQSTLGVRPVHGNPHVLFAPGGLNKAISRTLAKWNS